MIIVGKWGIINIPHFLYKVGKNLKQNKLSPEDKIIWLEINDTIYKLLQYDSGQYHPLIPKRIKEFSTSYPYRVILDTIKTCSNSITWAVHNKKFEKDTNRVQYILAIIERNLNDTYRKYKQSQIREIKESKIESIEETNKPIRSDRIDMSKFFDGDI